MAFRGVPAFALSADWEFLYLTLHAARHGLLPLKWLVDIDRFCSRCTLKWEKVKDRAKLLGWERAVQSSLSACATLLNTRVPTLFSETAVPASVKLDSSTLSALQIPRETLFGIRLLNSPWQKLRFLAVRLFIPTPADCQSVPLPSWFFFLYYALRPLRLACLVAWWSVQAGLRAVGKMKM